MRIPADQWNSILE